MEGTAVARGRGVGSFPPGRRSGLRRLTAHIAIVAVMVPLILACGATPVLLKTAPASQLQLWLLIASYSGQPSVPLPLDKVMVTAWFQTAQQGRVVLAGGQDLVCDGVDMFKVENVPNSSQAAMSVPALLDRQPPGGAYTCVYTDERGQQTTVVIPVLAGQLAITNPRAGARVPIPPPVPMPTPVTPLPTSGLAPPRVLHEPLAISYAMPALPSGGHAAVSVTVGCPSHPGAMVCGTVYGPESAAQGGTYVLADPRPPITSGFDYIFPGPGYVTLALTMDWSPASQGFQQVHVETRDGVTNAVTWTPSQP